jgi:hypothetical protein
MKETIAGNNNDNFTYLSFHEILEPGAEQLNIGYLVLFL